MTRKSPTPAQGRAKLGAATDDTLAALSANLDIPIKGFAITVQEAIGTLRTATATVQGVADRILAAILAQLKPSSVEEARAETADMSALEALALLSDGSRVDDMIAGLDKQDRKRVLGALRTGWSRAKVRAFGPAPKAPSKAKDASKAPADGAQASDEAILATLKTAASVKDRAKLAKLAAATIRAAIDAGCDARTILDAAGIKVPESKPQATEAHEGKAPKAPNARETKAPVKLATVLPGPAPRALKGKATH